jgi:hypothetical protein
LSEITNKRDRAVFEVLISFILQTPSKRGFRSGNRAGRAWEEDQLIIKEHAKWKATRSARGSDRQFAQYWFDRGEGEFEVVHERGLVLRRRRPKKPATDADIRRITKKLRDARRRIGTSIEPIDVPEL